METAQSVKLELEREQTFCQSKVVYLLELLLTNWVSLSGGQGFLVSGKSIA